MDLALIQAAYIVAALLFILSLAGLSKHETAKDGNILGMVGMAIAAAIGIWRARRVEMTGMPELIAMLHSFVGAAAVLVGINTFLASGSSTESDGGHLVEIFLGVFIGAVTFTG